jgi:hypothetical protein
MFDKTFFKFALGFAAIIIISLVSMYVTGYIDSQKGSAETASISK